MRTDQFEVHLQPQLYLATDRICGCEALIRWRHLHRGELCPAAFVTTAARIGAVPNRPIAQVSWGRSETWAQR